MDDKSLEGNIETPQVAKSSLSTSIMSLKMSNASVREWMQKRRESVQPWGEFMNWNKFKAPKAVAPAGVRIVKNIEKFQSNYLFVFIGLFAFCILTSPMLLFAIAGVLGACFVINHKSQDRKLVVMGHEISLAHQYSAVGALTIPLLWAVGAGATVFWVIGVSVVAILLHAITRVTDIEPDQLFEAPTIEV